MCPLCCILVVCDIWAFSRGRSDWDGALPDLIEAFVFSSSATVEAYKTRRVHSAFEKMYDVQIPLVVIDLQDWYEPFSVAGPPDKTELILSLAGRTN